VKLRLIERTLLQRGVAAIADALPDLISTGFAPTMAETTATTSLPERRVRTT